MTENIDSPPPPAPIIARNSNVRFSNRPLGSKRFRLPTAARSMLLAGSSLPHGIGEGSASLTCPLSFVDRPGPILETTDIIDFVVPHVLELFASKS